MSAVAVYNSLLQFQFAGRAEDVRDCADIYASYPWFRNFELHARPNGIGIVVPVFVGVSGEQLALPMFVDGSRAESMSNFYTPAFAPIEVGRVNYADASRALVGALHERGFASLHFGPLQSGAPFFYAMQHALRTRGYAVCTRPALVNWYLDARGLSWDRYLGSRPSRLRNTILRSERRLRRDHSVAITIVSGDDAQLEAAICAYEYVYARSWKREEPFPQFMSSLCKTAAREGWLRLGLLTIEDRAVAAQVWFHSAGVSSIYKLAYDEAHAGLGVGTVLTAAMLRHSLEVDQAEKVDFLTGDEPYKREWMSHRLERVQLIALQTKDATNWGRLAWMAGQRVRSMIRWPIRPDASAQTPAPPDQEPAVVVGLCAHGLAIVRALADAGVNVVALESNVHLPGYRTTRAEVIRIPDINGESLVSSLLGVSNSRFAERRPTLLLTNDTMVAVLAKHVDKIRAHYRLSWHEHPDVISRLLRKENIEARCRETGLSYPRSLSVESHAALTAMQIGLKFPIIAKPSKPLSTFKTIVAKSSEELTELLHPHSGSAPFLIQEFVPGGDNWIHFCALYLDRGRTVAHFEGRKLRSRPMGHTTIAETYSDSALLAYTQRFFDGLELSGPVSLEVKRDAAGTMWVIEPTVGRTDFWVGLCIQGGISIPAIEHFAQLGVSTAVNVSPRDAVWFNTERDPLALAWLALGSPLSLLGRGVATVYYHRSDLRPWLSAVGIQTERIIRSAWRRTFGRILYR